MSFNIESTLAGFESLKNNIIQTTQNLIGEGGDVMVQSVKNATPVMSGKLRESVYAYDSKSTGYSWEIKFAPHTIYARQRELGGQLFGKYTTHLTLRWFRDGRWHIRRTVYQTGSHYLERGVDASIAQISALLVDRWGAGMRA